MVTGVIDRIGTHRSLPIAGKDGLAVHVLRDFGPAGFEYTFGSDWKNDTKVKPGDIAGTPCVIIDSTENGKLLPNSFLDPGHATRRVFPAMIDLRFPFLASVPSEKSAA